MSTAHRRFGGFSWNNCSCHLYKGNNFFRIKTKQGRVVMWLLPCVGQRWWMPEVFASPGEARGCWSGGAGVPSEQSFRFMMGSFSLGVNILAIFIIEKESKFLSMGLWWFSWYSSLKASTCHRTWSLPERRSCIHMMALGTPSKAYCSASVWLAELGGWAGKVTAL